MAKDDVKSKGKKASEKDASKKGASDAHDTPKKAAPESVAAARSAAKEGAHGAHSHGVHAHAGHKVDRKQYWVIFVVLFVLTVLEVGVAQVGIGKTALYLALIGLAVTKAAAVGLYYMHLKNESKYLKLTVALPFAAPALYAVVLIAEGAWRGVR